MEDKYSGSGSSEKDIHGAEHDEKHLGPATAVTGEEEAFRAIKDQHGQVDQFIEKMEQELELSGQRKRFAGIAFKNPKHFTWVMVVFASMGGMLFGLDQSLISGANLFLPGDLGFTTRQVSLVNSSMPLGAVAGAILLSPSNEYLGRRGAIILATILYTIGAALEAGAIDYAMMVCGRIILGLGVGIETGTVSSL